METPENAKKISSSNTSSSSSESVAVQDSPVFDYISNLSPIKHVKAAPVAQGFQELNSPPLVLTSPQVNPHCQSSSFKRHHYPQSSCVEIYGEDDKGKTVITVADEFRKSNTQVSSELVHSTAKESDNKSSIQEQVGSPSRCVDAYFADIMNVDCADSTHSANLSLKQSRDAPQSPNALMESKEPVFKLEINNDIRKDVAMPTGASATALEQPEEDRQGKSSFDVKPVETDGKQGSGDIPSSPCPKVEYLSVDKNLDKQRYEHSVTKNAGAGCKVDLKSTSQVLPESLQIVPEDEDCDKPSEAISSEHFEDMMLNDPKASQHRRGMHRRCLQFEEDQQAQQKIIPDSPGYWNPSNSVTSSRSPASFVDSEVLESSFVDIPATPSNRQLTNMILSRNDENSSLKVSRPSGIGLHLNSIVTATPMGFCATASTKSAYRGYFNVQATNEDSRQDSHDSIAASSATSSFTSSGKPLNNTLLLKSNEHQATPCDKKRSNFERADGLELNQLSPKKKRKKTSGTSDGDGCKRCNCKKTKCLKLYCDCFAAGIYCAEPCACQGCFNRPEYEDTVLEVRQQRESRNPLAFAPKIIQHAAEPPAHTFGENENRLTSTSARHKRGCNCKKSMCLKKYCECYQANVGCSDGCRCEGCKNVYGRKEDYGISKDVVGKQTIEENLDCSFNEKLEMEATLKSSSHTEFCNPYHMTPMTPSFQYSYGKDASNSWFSGGGYLTTPESHLSLLESYGMSPGSPRNSDNHDMILETNKDILGFNSFDQELDYGYVEAVDESSPIFHGLGNAGHLAAPRNPPSMAMTSQTSPNTMERRNCSGNGRFQSVSSLRWRSSPITPMTQFGGTKILQVLDSDNRLSDIGDDTPEILKDTNTPLSAVKVTSPNKKRVSPPHPHLHALGSSSSTGLRSGRKFILQAVSSFPPLTPCVDPKDSSTSQNTTNPQH